MKIVIQRFKYTTQATFSKIYLDGAFICYLMEDTLRPFGVKVHSETGIPAGKGKLQLFNSPKFGLVPYLYNNDDKKTYSASGVKFLHLRIHAGNFIKDSEGCPMTGLTVDYNTERTYNSRNALNKLIKSLDEGREYDFEIKNLRQAN